MSLRCIWHPKRRALVCGTFSRCGYCRECWGSPRRLLVRRSVVGFVAEAAIDSCPECDT